MAKATKKPTEKKEVSVKKIGIWDYIKFLTKDKKELTDDELKGYEPYMINYFLSQCDALLPIIRMANDNVYVNNKKLHYNFLKSVIPRGFYSIPKAPPTEAWKTFRENAELVCKHKKIGMNDIRSYVEMYGLEELNKLAERLKPRSQSQ